MEPIGLTYKKDGEIMIVHKCLGCGKISPNRIAGDDNPVSILTLLDKTQPLKSNGYLLTPSERDCVTTVLFGKNSIERII